MNSGVIWRVTFYVQPPGYPCTVACDVLVSDADVQRAMQKMFKGPISRKAQRRMFCEVAWTIGAEIAAVFGEISEAWKPTISVHTERYPLAQEVHGLL